MAVIAFNLYSSQTGLTLEAQPRDASNSALGSPLAAGFIEKGLGAYQWAVPTLPAGTATVDIQLHSDHSFLGVSLDGSAIGLAGLAVPASAGGLPTVDASGRAAVNVEQWVGTDVSVSPFGHLPNVNVASIADSATSSPGSEGGLPTVDVNGRLAQPVNVALWAGVGAAVDANDYPVVGVRAIDDSIATAVAVATNIGNLDAAVSSRSVYDGADTAGTTTLLGRLTVARAGYLDTLNGIVSAVASAVWAAGTRTLTAFGFKPAVTLANTDVTGNLPADLQTIKTQVVTATGAYSFDAQTTAQGIVAGVATMLTPSGSNKTFTVDALKNAPAGGGGGGSAIVRTIQDVERSITDVPG